MSTTDNQEYWQQHVAAWQASEQSGAAYCREHDLVYHRFCYWRQKLLSSQRAEPVSSTGFTRVLPVPGAAATELRISLPGGIAISGLHAGNIALLGAILRQL